MSLQKNLDQDYEDQIQNQFGMLFSDQRINKPHVIEQTNESLQTNEEADRFSTYEQQDVFLCFSPPQEREKVSSKVTQSFQQTDGQQTEEICQPFQNCRNCFYIEKLVIALKQEAQSFHSSISSQQTNFTVISNMNQLFENIVEEMKIFRQYSNLNQLAHQDSKNQSFEGSQISFDYWQAERELRLQEYCNQFNAILSKILQMEQYNIHHLIKERVDNYDINESNLSAINNCKHDKQESISLQLSDFSQIDKSLDQDQDSIDFSPILRHKVGQRSAKTTRDLNLREQIQVELDQIFDECIDKEFNQVQNIKRVGYINKNIKKYSKTMINIRDKNIFLEEKQQNSPQSLQDFPLFQNSLNTSEPLQKGISICKNNSSSRTTQKVQKNNIQGNSSGSATIFKNFIKLASKKQDFQQRLIQYLASQAKQANQSIQNQDMTEQIFYEQEQFINQIQDSEIQQTFNFYNQDNFNYWLNYIKANQIQDSLNQVKINEIKNQNYDLNQNLFIQDFQISLNQDLLNNNPSVLDVIRQKTQVTVSTKNNRPKIFGHKATRSDSGTAVRKFDSPIQEPSSLINRNNSESKSNSQQQSAKKKANIDLDFCLFENYDYEIHRQKTDEIYQSHLGSQKSYFENQTFLGSAQFDQQSFEESHDNENSNFLLYNQFDENIYDQNLRLVYSNRYNPSTQEQKYGLTMRENPQRNRLRTFQSSKKQNFFTQNSESLSNQEAPYNQNESKENQSRFQSFYNNENSQNLFGYNHSNVTKEISCKMNSARESSKTLSNHFQTKAQNFGNMKHIPPIEYITRQQSYQDKLQETEEYQESKPKLKDRERASSFRLKPKTSQIKFKEHENQQVYFLNQIETNSQNYNFEGTYQSPTYKNGQKLMKKFDLGNCEKLGLQINTSFDYIPHNSPTPNFNKEREIQIIEECASDNDKQSSKSEVNIQLPFNQLAAGSVVKETIRPRANTSPAEWNLNFHTRTANLRDRSSSGGLNSSRHKELSQHLLYSSSVIEEEDESNNLDQQNSEKSTQDQDKSVPLRKKLTFQAPQFGRFGPSFGPSLFGKQNLYRNSTIKQPSKGPFAQANPIQNTQIPQMRGVGYPYAHVGRSTFNSQMKNQLVLNSIPNSKIQKVQNMQQINEQVEMKFQNQSDKIYNNKSPNYNYLPNNYINLANNYLLVQLPNQQNCFPIQHPSFRNDDWPNLEQIKEYYPNDQNKDIAEKKIKSIKLQQFQQNNQILSDQDSYDQLDIQEYSEESIQIYSPQKVEPQSAKLIWCRPQSLSMVENDFMSIQQTPKQSTIEKFDSMQSNDAKYNDKNIGSNLRCGLKSKTPTKAFIPSLQKQNKEIKVEKVVDQNGKPSVSFIKIYRHEPTRRNINDNLIDWQNEVTYDYRFSKYLEQNRFERLFSNSELLGEGGFGKVYKVLHGLDNRYYAIKEIPIHLGLLQNFTEHSVYREILAISQVMHTNVVRYHACWIESASPREDKIKKAVKKIETDTKKKWRARKAEALKDTPDKSSKALGNKFFKASHKIKQNASKQILKEQGSFRLTSESFSRCDDNKKQKNLLKKIEQESDMTMDANWHNHVSSSQTSLLTLDKKQSSKTKMKNLLDSENQSSSEFESSSSDESSSDESSSESSSKSSNSSSDSESSVSESNKKSKSGDQSDDSSSSNINEKFATQLKKVQGKLFSSSSQFSKKEKFSKRKEQIEISEEESDNDDESDTSSVDSTSSLYELISKGQDFITLNVMIQMEFCKGDTLRAILDSKDYYVNRKRVFLLFKQLILGLMHIHGEGLIHRDIKPANIFIDKTRMVLKIGDFGLAKLSNFNVQLEQEIQDLKRNKMSCADLQINGSKTVNLDKSKLQASLSAQRENSVQQLVVPNDQRKITKEMEASICAGTPLYQAPEQTIQELTRADNANEPINRLTEKVDMYAAGLILYEMCQNFKTQHSRITAFDLLKTQRQLPHEFNQMNQEREIILNLTDPDPRKRSSAMKLLEDKIFTNWSFEMKEETFMKSENKQGE